MSVPAPPAAPIGMGKAYAAAGATVLGGALAKIVIRILNVRYPGFLDPGTIDALDTLFVGGLTTAAVYFTPHGGS